MMWDAIIVGAGPAGSALASLLALKDRSILLLDAAKFPREKLCGEYLSPGCLKILEQLGVLRKLQQFAHPIYGMRVCSPKGSFFTARFPEGENGLALRRTQLDHLLLEHSRQKPVECLEEFRVERLLIDSGKVCGIRGRSRNGRAEILRARIIIGADGRNSVVARNLGLFRPHPSHRKSALCAHYEGVEGSDGYAEIFIGCHGYGILNPLADGTVNINLVIDQKHFVRAKGRLEDCFSESIEGLPMLRSRLRGSRRIEKVRALGPLAYHVTRASSDGALLLGDAAGFYDPLTGEGVYMALKGAQLAARVIERAFQMDNFSTRVLSRYEIDRTKEFRNRFRLETLIQMILRRPSLTDVITWQFQRRRRFADSFMAVLGGLIPLEELFSVRAVKSLVIPAN